MSQLVLWLGTSLTPIWPPNLKLFRLRNINGWTNLLVWDCKCDNFCKKKWVSASLQLTLISYIFTSIRLQRYVKIKTHIR